MVLFILGNLIVSSGIAMIEIPALIKKKGTKDLWVFSILLLIATILSIMTSAGIEIITPLELVSVVYKPFTKNISWLVM